MGNCSCLRDILFFWLRCGCRAVTLIALQFLNVRWPYHSPVDSIHDFPHTAYKRQSSRSLQAVKRFGTRYQCLKWKASSSLGWHMVLACVGYFMGLILFPFCLPTFLLFPVFTFNVMRCSDPTSTYA